MIPTIFLKWYINDHNSIFRIQFRKFVSLSCDDVLNHRIHCKNAKNWASFVGNNYFLTLLNGNSTTFLSSSRLRYQIQSNSDQTTLAEHGSHIVI